MVTEMVKKHGIEGNTIFKDFVAPWDVPMIYRTADLVVCGEYDYPVKTHHPRISREAAACGVPTMLSRELYGKYPYRNFKDEVETIVFDPLDGKRFVELLDVYLNNIDKLREIGKNARLFAEKHENFEAHVDNMLRIYKEVTTNA